MRITFQSIVFLALCATVLSCKKDNYDPPSSTLSGRLLYQGEPIGLERDQVPLELYQFGFGKVGAIGGTFAQDGSYSALLFDGDYKLIIPNGQGPFLWDQTVSGTPDSIDVAVRGSQTLDLEVTPYYMIRNSQIAASGGTVTAIFGIEKIVTDANAKDVENVELYINKTQFVSGGNRIEIAGMNGTDITDMNNITLSLTVPEMVPAQNYVFARIGLKLAGVEDRIFSPLQKIQL